MTKYSIRPMNAEWAGCGHSLASFYKPLVLDADAPDLLGSAQDLAVLVGMGPVALGAHSTMSSASMAFSASLAAFLAASWSSPDGTHQKMMVRTSWASERLV